MRPGGQLDAPPPRPRDFLLSSFPAAAPGLPFPGLPFLGLRCGSPSLHGAVLVFHVLSFILSASRALSTSASVHCPPCCFLCVFLPLCVSPSLSLCPFVSVFLCVSVSLNLSSSIHLLHHLCPPLTPIPMLAVSTPTWPSESPGKSAGQRAASRPWEPWRLVLGEGDKEVREMGRGWSPSPTQTPPRR